MAIPSGFLELVGNTPLVRLRKASEQTGCETLAELLAEVETSFSNAADRVRVLATADFNTFRGVGRKQLPT